MTAFSQMGFSSRLLRAIEGMGWKHPTDIQKKAIPQVLLGRDVMAIAETGSGKTGAFLLPILQKLDKEKSSHKTQCPFVLVLAPTRELAIQLHKNANDLGSSLSKKVCLLVGGLSALTQKEALNQHPEIIVATPGRLLDHIRQGNVDLSDIGYLVLDEADRMLDMGFWPDIKKVLACCPNTRQSLLFSATLSDDIHLLAQKLLKRPVLIEVNANRDAATVLQKVFRVPECEKPIFLRDLIVDNGLDQVLIFTRRKESAAKLAGHLKEDGFTVEALHGDKTQARRLKILEAFKNHELRILVATDLASRGIDIKELPVVINYELPQDPHDYIHRIGRTGRAGSEGLAYSLMSEKDAYKLGALEVLLKKKLTVETPEVYERYFESRPIERKQTVEKPLKFSSKTKRDDLKKHVERKQKGTYSKEKTHSRQKRELGKDSFDYILPDF